MNENFDFDKEFVAPLFFISTERSLSERAEKSLNHHDSAKWIEISPLGPDHCPPASVEMKNKVGHTMPTSHEYCCSYMSNWNEKIDNSCTKTVYGKIAPYS